MFDTPIYHIFFVKFLSDFRSTNNFVPSGFLVGRLNMQGRVPYVSSTIFKGLAQRCVFYNCDRFTFSF